MADVETDHKELKNTGYEIFIGILSILSIVNIVLIYVADDPKLDTVINAMNGLFSIIFLGDFTYRLLTARSKSQYFFRQFGWADLLASLPFAQAKVLRVFRLVRVFRLLRGTASSPSSAASSRTEPAARSSRCSSWASWCSSSAASRSSTSSSTHPARTSRPAPMRSGTSSSPSRPSATAIAIPVTNRRPDRRCLIIVIGVGIFGTFTGYLANLFLTPSTKPATTPAPTAPSNVRAKVSELKELMAQQQAQQQAAMDDIDLLLQSDAT